MYFITFFEIDVSFNLQNTMSIKSKTNFFITFNSKTKHEEQPVIEDSVELPGPDGPTVSRIPELLPEQEKRSKDNINLNYVSVINIAFRILS